MDPHADADAFFVHGDGDGDSAGDDSVLDAPVGGESNGAGGHDVVTLFDHTTTAGDADGDGDHDVHASSPIARPGESVDDPVLLSSDDSPGLLLAIDATRDTTANDTDAETKQSEFTRDVFVHHDQHLLQQQQQQQQQQPQRGVAPAALTDMTPTSIESSVSNKRKGTPSHADQPRRKKRVSALSLLVGDDLGDDEDDGDFRGSDNGDEALTTNPHKLRKKREGEPQSRDTPTQKEAMGEERNDTEEDKMMIATKATEEEKTATIEKKKNKKKKNGSLTGSLLYGGGNDGDDDDDGDYKASNGDGDNDDDSSNNNNNSSSSSSDSEDGAQRIPAASKGKAPARISDDEINGKTADQAEISSDDATYHGSDDDDDEDDGSDDDSSEDSDWQPGEATAAPEGTEGGGTGAGSSDESSEEDEEVIRWEQEQLAQQAQEIRLRLERTEHSYFTGVLYDEGMTLHRNPAGSHVEQPERIQRIYQQLVNCGITQFSRQYQSRQATRDEIATVHSHDYMDFLYRIETLNDEQLTEIATTRFNSMYLCQDSLKSALLSCGGVLTMLEAIMTNQVRNGFAVVRPPGHHAEHNEAMGFCLIDNVAVAARTAQAKYNLNRILIVDWDVHHGNGIQRVFQDDPNVLYISLHRYDHGLFYPHSKDADITFVGTPGAEGRTINIAWSPNNTAGMTDGDYLFAFEHIIMPVAREFQPQLIIVAAGFDAARGDPLGAYDITPAGFSQMTHLLSSLADGQIMLVLEGGYNLCSTAMSVAACISVLMGSAPMKITNCAPCESAIATVRKVAEVHSKYWASLPRVVDVIHYFKSDDSEKDTILETAHLDGALAPKPIMSYLQSVSSLLDGIMWDAMVKSRMYKFPLKMTNPPATVYCTSRALTSEGPLMLLFHGSGYIRFTNQTGDNLLNPNSSFLTGTIAPFVDTAQREGYNVLAVHVHTSLLDDREHTASEDLRRLVLYLWDEYISTSDAAKIVVIADTVGMRCLTPLYTSRNVEPKIAGTVVFAMPGRPSVIPHARKAPMLKDKASWFYQTSKVLMPSNDELGSELHLQRRFGHCFSAGPVSTALECPWTLKEEAFLYLRDRTPIPAIISSKSPILSTLDGDDVRLDATIALGSDVPGHAPSDTLVEAVTTPSIANTTSTTSVVETLTSETAAPLDVMMDVDVNAS